MNSNINFYSEIILDLEIDAEIDQKDGKISAELNYVRLNGQDIKSNLTSRDLMHIETKAINEFLEMDGFLNTDWE